jgi:hypothetical protein
MSSVESWLAGSGDRTGKRDFGCWRVEQIGIPATGSVTLSTTPQRSHILSLWLDRLRDRPGSLAYRIGRAGETD